MQRERERGRKRGGGGAKEWRGGGGSRRQNLSPSILRPPLLSEAVTPARRTSLPRYVPSPNPPPQPRCHWLSDGEQRAADWPRAPAWGTGKEMNKKSEEGGRERGDQWINAHSWSLWCGSAQRSNEP